MQGNGQFLVLLCRDPSGIHACLHAVLSWAFQRGWWRVPRLHRDPVLLQKCALGGILPPRCSLGNQLYEYFALTFAMCFSTFSRSSALDCARIFTAARAAFFGFSTVITGTSEGIRRLECRSTMYSSSVSSGGQFTTG